MTVDYRALALFVLVAAGGAVVRSEHVEADTVGVPVDRLVANLEAALRERPRHVGTIVNLARTHMIAYAQKTSEMRVERSKELKGPAAEWLKENVMPAVRQASGQKAKTAAAHLAKALSRYDEALALEPDHPYARLGYAWTLQQAGRKDEAVRNYREAIRLAWPNDNAQRFAMFGSQSITEEAIRFLLPLLDPEQDRDEIGELKARRTSLAAIKRAITPIAVPLADGLSAQDLVDESATVVFDLDGSGVPRRWTWITPRAAWLVHTPPERREVTSALQLFGNVTFWLFWSNGYEALAALDDNRDGELRGPELRDLSLWRDTDADGRSAPGELLPLASCGIVALATQYRHDPTHPDEIAYAPSGAIFKDGRTRPTFDLVLHRR